MEPFWLSAERRLDEAVLLGRLPEELLPDEAAFAALWALHPAEYHLIKLHGRPVRTPRWQQAYGADYRYSGNRNPGLPLLPVMEPFLGWARRTIEPRLGGLLFNWYDGALGHYIGPHRDSTAGLVPGTPIVTISLGEGRAFRLRRHRDPERRGFVDVPMGHGTVLAVPWEVNRRFTHEVPAPRGATGRRISITLRAFAGG